MTNSLRTPHLRPKLSSSKRNGHFCRRKKRKDLEHLSSEDLHEDQQQPHRTVPNDQHHGPGDSPRAPQRIHAKADQLTIKDLRRNKTLTKQADHTLADWLDESSNDDEPSGNDEPRGKHVQACKSPRNLPKSGSDVVGQDDILKPIKWPHLSLLNIDGSTKLWFSDLSMQKLVAGELEIVLDQLKELEHSNSNPYGDVNAFPEVLGRVSRLKDTMYFSILYDFNVAKEYFKQVGLQIERGKADWGGDFNQLAKWLFHKPPSDPRPPNVSSKASQFTKGQPKIDETTDFICALFNFKECRFLKESGKCKRVHICVHCFKRGVTQEHRAIDCKHNPSS